ncbi:MAG: hypothetical protein ACI4JJ_06735 [Huintestinicola sp.]
MESTVSYKCPNCGGDLRFNADGQNFICEWCSSDFTKAEVDKLCGEISPEEKQKAEEEETAERKFAEDTDVYICSSCGAEVICDHETAASFCYYCHNPITLKGRLEGQYRPEQMIPFKLSRLAAEKAFKDACKNKWFLPSDFLSDKQIEKMTALYVPFWLADCDVDAFIQGEGKNVISVRHGDTTVTTTKIYAVERGGKMSYSGVPADGSKKIEDAVMDAIEPFDYNGLVPFSMTYLSGCYADKYDVEKSEVLGRIKERIDKSSEELLRNDIKGYQSVTVKNKQIRILSTKWHYMLLPVWFMTYKYHGQIYSYAINGQTGKMAGKYPVSLPKALGFGAAIGLILALAVFLTGGLSL